MKTYKGEKRTDELAKRQTRQYARMIAKRRNHKLEKSKNGNGYWVIYKNQNGRAPEYYDRLSDYVLQYLDTTKF